MSTVSAAAPSIQRRQNDWLGWASLLAPWLVSAWMLRTQWAFSIERWHGFAVFPLAAYLFVCRWERLTSATPTRTAAAVGRTLRIVGIVLTIVALPALTASPLWTAAGWLACGGAVMATLGAVMAVGGASYAQAVWFPAVFALTALPWPAFVATRVVDALRSLDASLAAEIVSALGHPTLAHGAVLETPRGWVGIADACSGLVGLQAAIMLSLFLGELQSFRTGRRVAVTFASAALALFANATRTTWLTWIGATAGADAVLRHHDMAAYLELTATLAAVITLSLRQPAEPPLPVSTQWPRLPASGAAWIALALLVVGLGANAAWFYSAPADHRPRQAWQLHAPNEDWKPFALAPAAKTQLRFDEATCLRWSDAISRRDWIVVHLRWDADPAVRYAPGLHRPEKCLPAAGARLDAEFGLRTVVVEHVPVELRCSRFVAEGAAFYTFFCLWDPVEARTVDPEAYAQLDLGALRRQMIRARQHEQPLEQLTIAVNQCRDENAALDLVRTLLPQLLHRR